MFSFEVLEKLYKAYQEKEVITEKQRRYVEILASDNPFPKISSILRRSITSWEDVKKSEVSLIISILQQSHLADVKLFRPKNHDHVILTSCDFEYGYQDSVLCVNERLYYVKFYDLLMIDYDRLTLEEVKKIIGRRKDLSFRLYKTHNGFHAFVVNKLINHQSEEAQELMKELECDDFYRLYSYNNGYKIRLSPKKDRKDEVIASYIETIGEEIDVECMRLIAIHDYYLR